MAVSDYLCVVLAEACIRSGRLSEVLVGCPMVYLDVQGLYVCPRVGLAIFASVWLCGYLLGLTVALYCLMNLF